MRDDIRNVIVHSLREEGELTTRQIQEQVASSDLPRNQHRYSVLRNHYLEPLADEGILILVKEQPIREGGGLWRLKEC